MASYGDLTNIFVPDVQNGYVDEFSTTKSALWQSGIVQTNAKLSSDLTTLHGNIFTTPFNKPIEDEVAKDADTSDTAITLRELTTGTQTSVRQYKADGWDERDLAVQLSGNDASAAVARKLGLYWRNNYQKQLLSAIKGVILDNANDGGDLVNDVYTDITTPLETAKINNISINDAAGTMGDAWQDLGAIAMHSSSRKKLKNDEPNAFVPASETNIGFATYNGLIIIEDDGLVTTAGTNSPEYETLLFGMGAFQFGDAGDVVKQEVHRQPLTGNGGGGTALLTRRSFIMHPTGFDCSATNVKVPVTTARLEVAAAWDRIVTSRKQIKFAMLKHNV